MSTTLYLLALDERNLALYLEAQEAERAYFRLIGEDLSAEMNPDAFTRVDKAYTHTGDAWYEARVALGRGDQLAILESSHRDIEPCEVVALFAAGENFTLTVTEENIQELADAWEASDRKRTFSVGRGKGTVVGWLLEHRGQIITLGS